MDYKKDQLSNGLKIIMNKNPHQKTATIAVLVNVGSNWETLEVNGLAHFVEHLFFKGTKKRLSQLILSRELDQYGAHKNAFTNNEMTCYHIKVNADHLEKVIEILGDILCHSLYRPNDIELEKKVVINEIHQRNSIPTNKINNDFYLKFFKDLPIAKPVAGKASNIKKFNRNIVLAFIYYYYRPENMVISVAGNFKSYKWLKEHLERHFSTSFYENYNKSFSRLGDPSSYDSSSVFNKTLKSLSDYQSKWLDKLTLNLNPILGSNNNITISTNSNSNDNVFPSINNHIETHSSENLEHTFVIIAFKGYNYQNIDKYKLQLLAMILGGGMSSRLFENIRSKHGLVYSISASHTAHDFNGTFTIQYSCNHNIKTQIEILKLIKKELDLLKNELITEKEYLTTLEKLKNQVKMAQEDTYENCLHYGLQLLKNQNLKQIKGKENSLEKIEVKNYQEIFKEYKKITKEDLQTYANKIFKFDAKHFLITTLSPVKVKEKIYEETFYH